MPRHIMIIGAGLLQLPAIKAAQEMGLSTIVTDYDKEAYGLKLADYPIIMSTRDIEGSVRVAKSLHQRLKIDGVITVGTDASMTVAAVANALSLPGIKFEDAEAASNKIKMRKRLQEHNVPQPMFMGCWTLEDVKHAVREIGFPLVIKPADNMGARGVRKLESPIDIEEAFQQAKEASPRGEIVVEQYMEGHELSIDCLIFNNEITFNGIADRIIEYPPYFVETGHIMPSRLPKVFIDDAKLVMSQGIKALGLTIGAAKGDIKITKDGAKVGEIAARLSGGFMSAYTYPYSSGVNLIQNAIYVALGEGPPLLTPKFQKISIEKALIPGEGIVKEIDGINDALAIEGVKQVFLHKGIGDELVGPRSNLDKLGNLIVQADSYSEAEELVNLALSKIKVTMEKHEGLNQKDMRKRALERFNKACSVCKVCDGRDCRGRVPGIGSIGTGASFINNLKALERYKIIPNYIHSNVEADTRTLLFGVELDLPVITSPITGASTNLGGNVSEEELAEYLTTGSYIAGTIAMVGDGASPDKYKVGLKAIKNLKGHGIPIFKPRKEQKDIIRRIHEAEEVGAIAVGVDIDAGSFITMTLKNQPVEAKTPDQLRELIQSTTLPFILKGIMSPADAKVAVDCGAKAIMVSNHGGRVMDHMPGTIDVLSDIVKTVGNQILVMVDGGFRSGGDVYKGLALGAKIIGLGRPVVIAGFGGEEQGVKLLFDQYRDELKRMMTLTGAATVNAIKQQQVKEVLSL